MCIADKNTFNKTGAEIDVIAKPTIKPRDKNSYKNNYGTALTVCGSYGMPGAAIISARAALRTGVGILRLSCIEENYTACAISAPEAILVPCKSNGKTYDKSATLTIKEELGKADALLIGCGMGVSQDAGELVKELLINTKIPTVLDADGINLIAFDIELFKQVKAPLVLTPHPGEMARLCKATVAEIEQDRITYATEFAKEYGVYMVLKGSNTVVADPDGNVSINKKGNPGMATAGSGDMLAGIIVALLARGFSPYEAIKAGVWLHSAAGDAAAKRLGENAMLPTDMIEELHRFI